MAEVKKYNVKVRIVSKAESDLPTEKMQSAVAATYEHVLHSLNIPFEFLEVEVDEIKILIINPGISNN